MSEKVNKKTWAASHRPWPLPKLPWVMKQTWNNALFIHYPIQIDALQKLVPEVLTLDSYDGWGWIGIVPFHMEGVRFRGMPVSSTFPELNVRTYVTINGKPGVYFFSLDATNLPMVAFAQKFCYLPYSHANIDIQRNGDSITFKSRRKKDTAIRLDCSYCPTSKPFLAARGSFDEWLTERYCFYTTNAKGRVLRCDILHRPWPLQRAEAEIRENTVLLAQNIVVEQVPPVLHYSQGVVVRIWPMLLA
ncbi:YqjF family protein [Paenibacillus lentus]|uniref:YqjF family protein n=1 Tax=Paenibacillus lentus TaxID=1338368 RepID=UPI003660B860